MKKLQIIGINAIFFLMFATVYNAEGGDVLDSIHKINSVDSNLQKEGMKDLLMQRQKIITGLIKILEHDGDIPKGRKLSPSLEAAMNVLGEMRAIEAVNVLMLYINFPSIDMPIVQKITSLDKIYPAVKSLINIGMPSLHAVIQKVKDSDKSDATLVTKCRYIIFKILGAKLGQVYIEDVLNNEMNSKKQSRIRSLLKSFN